MTRQQQDLITGKLLGDGSLENRGTANSRLQVRHSIRQKEYVDWCYRQLEELVPAPPRQHEDSYYFRTRSLPVFTRLRKIWYSEDRKLLPGDLRLSPFVLAIWYMDDGYYDRVRNAVWISTHCFNQQEIQILQDLLSGMNVGSGMVKDRSHYKIRILSKDKGRFVQIIRPHILPSLLYKIGIAP